MRKFVKFTGLTLAILLVLAGLTRLSMDPIGEYAINRWFENQGLQSEVADVNYDVDDGVFELYDLKVSADGKPVLRLAQVTVDWSWSELLDNQLILESITISGLDFEVERNSGELVVAGVDLAALKAEQKPSSPVEESEPLDWSLLLKQLMIEDFNLCYRALPQHDYCSRFDELTWDGDLQIDLAQADAELLAVSFNGDFHLDNIRIHNNPLDRVLLGFDHFEIEDMQADTLNDIDVASIELRALSLMERADASEPAQITRLDELRLEALKLSDRSLLEIGEVSVREHEVILVKQTDQQLEVETWLPAKTTDTVADAAPEAEATAADKAFDFVIGKFSYQTGRSVQYQDFSLEKPFVADLNSIELLLQNLDSREPDQPSTISYKAKYSTHGSLSLEGTASPLSPHPSFDLKGRIEGMDLRDLSAFSAAAIGHTIKSGQLDADLDLKAVKGQLASAVDLTLHHFNLAALSAADKEKIDTSFGFPLNTSLSLLKDRDNQISLNIPITGDFESPDFDPSDAITKATSSAITAAVLNYYTPFGLVTLVDGIFSLATALKFEPVVFANGSSEIESVKRGGIDKVAELMQERPGIHVTLCAFTNSADRSLLLPETTEIPVEELKLDEQQSEVLRSLGDTRAAGVKQYLVDKNIDPSRLVLCTAEHREGEGLSGIEISI